MSVSKYNRQNNSSDSEDEQINISAAKLDKLIQRAYKKGQKDSSSNDAQPYDAAEAVKKGLYNVKVCKYDADQIEREIQGELFDKYHESCDVTKNTRIPVENLKGYLDHLRDAVEGVDDTLRKQMDGVLFSEGSWEKQIFEYKFNKGEDSGTRYGVIAFGRSQDRKFVDCMYAIYKLNFKLSPQRIETKTKKSILFGLCSWEKRHVEYVERSIGAKTIKAQQNYFRTRALQEFCKAGVIDRINYVQSLDAIED